MGVSLGTKGIGMGIGIWFGLEYYWTQSIGYNECVTWDGHENHEIGGRMRHACLLLLRYLLLDSKNLLFEQRYQLYLSIILNKRLQ